MSEIILGDSLTTYNGHDAVHLLRARVIISGLRLYAKTGMKLTRTAGITQLLRSAAEYTRKTYRRGDALRAADDLEQWAIAMETALPIIDRRTVT